MYISETDNLIGLLCQPNNGQDGAWEELYEASFPKNEKIPIDDMHQLLNKEKLVLHQTLGKSNKLLCFSIACPIDDLMLLFYMATIPEMHSCGVGTRHLKQLIKISNAHLFLEIESSYADGLDAATIATRNRLAVFYEKFGAKTLDKEYYIPSLYGINLPRRGELMWIECANKKPIDQDTIIKAICLMYKHGYDLDTSSSLLQKILSQFT